MVYGMRMGQDGKGREVGDTKALCAGGTVLCLDAGGGDTNLHV